jgi:hypothetical protein
MEKKLYLLLLLLFLFFQETSAIPDISITFNSKETKYIEIPINFEKIDYFSFNLTGLSFENSYPSNISIDICDDSEIDWSYFSYFSEEKEEITRILNAWSTNPNSAEIYIRSSMSKDSYGTGLAYLKNNKVKIYSNELKGNLGITNTAETINSQIISITSEEKTIHAFLPYLENHLFAGFYVTKGGSTYYCNEDHTFSSEDSCNLDFSEAITPTHLARKANNPFFNFTEPITNSKIVSSINQYLSKCEIFPCDLKIKISSDSPGELLLSNFNIIPSEEPAKIESIKENSENYQIDISNTTSIEEIKYFYGKMPNVYLIPFIANDDSINLTTNQKERLNYLASSINHEWDNLTENKHPLNFTIYLTPFKTEYLISENDLSSYLINSEKYAINNLKIYFPAILIIIDIKNYFYNQNPYNSRKKNDSSGIISEIYLNGFSDKNEISNLDKYNTQILKNILLHEIAHSFIFNPYKEKLFYKDHPASFTNLENFSTYSPEESPTNSEGYYEIYSILNQIRPYILDEEIGNLKPILSELEKMLLGILNPYSKGEHTFYSGEINKINNRYKINLINEIEGENSSELYTYSDDEQWWDIRNTPFINLQISNPIYIPKENQNNRAIWIYINDKGHSENFNVINLNANSIKKIFGEETCIPFLVNTSWSQWLNISCLSNNKLNQSRNLVQYDINSCGTISNKSFYEYRQIIDCDYENSYFNSGKKDNQNKGLIINPEINKTDKKETKTEKLISKIKELKVRLIKGTKEKGKEILLKLIIISIISTLMLLLIIIIHKERKRKKQNVNQKE